MLRDARRLTASEGLEAAGAGLDARVGDGIQAAGGGGAGLQSVRSGQKRTGRTVAEERRSAMCQLGRGMHTDANSLA